MENPQTQAQTQAGTPRLIEAEYRTWGRFGQYKEDIVILNNFSIIRPSQVEAPSRKGTKRILTINGIKVTIENHDSRKNKHTIVHIPENEVYAIVRITQTFGNKYVSTTRGEVVEVEELKEELSNDKRYKLTKVYKNMYFVEGDKEVLIDSKLVDVKKELIAKPRITLTKENHLICVKGDTYHVKETLKKLGFKYDSTHRVWYTNVGSVSDLTELKKIAEVIEK